MAMSSRANRRSRTIWIAALTLTGGLLLPASPARADDCHRLGGTVVAGECQLASAVSVSGAFELSKTLRILGTGQITVSPTPATDGLGGGPGQGSPADGLGNGNGSGNGQGNGSVALAPGNALSITIAGDFVMDAGAQIAGGVTTSDSRGATITIDATGRVVLGGTGSPATSARISANGLPDSCAAGGRAGTIALTAGGDILTEAGSVIQANSQCPAGEIGIKSTGGDITLAGLVESASGTTSPVLDTLQVPRGGPITITAACGLAVDPTGKVSSRGLNPGADLVHLDGGCDVVVRGLVESTGGTNPSPALPNRCADASHGGKTPGAPACVEVFAGRTLTIDNSGANSGQISADSGLWSSRPVVQGPAWIDLHARGDIVLRAGAGDFESFAVRASQFVSNGFGGEITVKSVSGAVLIQGQASCTSGPECGLKAIVANARAGSGGRGGKVTIEAGGNGTPAGDVDLGDGLVYARGGFNSGAGGQISIRSFSGRVVGRAPGSVAADGGPAGAGGAVSEARGCSGTNYTGFQSPTMTALALSCGGAPGDAAAAALPSFLSAAKIAVAGGSFRYDGAPHPATGTVLGASGESLGAPTFTYNGRPDAPVAVGSYTVVASFAGNATHGPASGTGTITILPPNAPSATVRLVGGAFIYDGAAHPATGSVLGANGELLGAPAITYNGESDPPRKAGAYTVIGLFPGDTAHVGATATTTITIAKAVPTVTLTGTGNLLYDGNPHLARGSVTGVKGEGLGQPAITYTLNGAPVPFPINAGTYTVVGSFAGNANYQATSTTATLVLEGAMPTISVTGGTFAYDGRPHPATGSVVGLNGEGLGAPRFTYNGSSAAPVNSGVYAVVATFPGNASYVPVVATTTITITGEVGSPVPPVGPSCAVCDKVGSDVATIVVDQDVSIDFNPAVPACSGSPALCASFRFDKTGKTPDTWRAIFDLGGRKLLVKSGATIGTSRVRGRSAPGIEIRSTCGLELEEGAAIALDSKSAPGGDIVLQADGGIVLDGTVSNTATAGGGTPGRIAIGACCGGIVTGPRSRILTLSRSAGGGDIALGACCEGGDVVLRGLIDAAHKGTTAPTVSIGAMAGAVLVDGTNPFEIEAGTRRQVMSGITVRSSSNLPGSVNIQARRDVSVVGHTVVLDAVHPTYGTIAVKAKNAADGGAIDVRSLEGQIVVSDRALDNADRNRDNPTIALLARGDVELVAQPPARGCTGPLPLSSDDCDDTNTVVSTRTSGSHGGTNTIRSFAGQVRVGANVNVQAGNGRSARAQNVMSGCGGVINEGSIDPSPAAGAACAPAAPEPLFLGCALPTPTP